MSSDGGKEKDDYQSAALDALKDFKKEAVKREEKKEARQQAKGKKKKLWLALQWVLLLASITIFIFQAPRLLYSITKENKPHRIGTYDTDKRTDMCIKNLWKVSALLQQDKLPEKNMLCPVSQKPYEITESGDDIIVSSPSPELYGFEAIQVSKKKPVPELIR